MTQANRRTIQIQRGPRSSGCACSFVLCFPKVGRVCPAVIVVAGAVVCAWSFGDRGPGNERGWFLRLQPTGLFGLFVRRALVPLGRTESRCALAERLNKPQNGRVASGLWLKMKLKYCRTIANRRDTVPKECEGMVDSEWHQWRGTREADDDGQVDLMYGGISEGAILLGCRHS